VYLIDDWKRLAPRLWSIRLAIVAALLGVAEMALPFFHQAFPPSTFAALSILAALGSAAARLVPQLTLKK